MKKKILFVINQFFKGGAETSLLNLLHILSPEKYEIDFMIFDQFDLPNTISLISQIPAWIHVINICENEKKMAFVKKACFKIYRKVTKQQLFRQSAFEYLKSRKYDAAVSFGEWFSSALVAVHTIAKRKYVWIHADMDKAAFVHPDIAGYEQYFDGFLFASELSRNGAVKKYPFLVKRSMVVHNPVDRNTLLAKSSEKTSPLFTDGLPVLLTVANVRREKNHMRQIRVMQRLRSEGLDFHWVNIGSLADMLLVQQLKREITVTGLEDRFHLVGPKENPYPYMKMANAVCVFSDHESWSMVITEAKALSIPVIATRTSGALEQIIPNQTGILCDFTEEAITEKLSTYLNDPSLQARIRKNLMELSAHENDTLEALEPILLCNKKKLLYVVDDANYVSGARNAALMQIACLRKNLDTDLFSAQACRDPSVLELCRVIDLAGNRSFCSLLRPFREVWKSGQYSIPTKLQRLFYTVCVRAGKESAFCNRLLGKEMAYVLEGYDTVCVLSEASKFRAFVSGLSGPRKIQWIHTDYAAWRETSEWTRNITKNDAAIYSGFDAIVCLSERLRTRFLQLYPEFCSKTAAIPNLVHYEEIRKDAGENCPVSVNTDVCNLITVGRMETEKRYDRVLETAAVLKKRGFLFHWYLVGDGNLYDRISRSREELHLCDEITLTGNLENPYPLMRHCDFFVLLSDYEGTPVTIDEAKVLGLPVLATNVGGIADQLQEGKYGDLVSNNGEEIAAAIIKAEKNCREKGRGPTEFKKENQTALEKIKRIIGGYYDA